ncbi:hypothetical protein HHI36_023027 [Cryptolaemus montrouzieri]
MKESGLKSPKPKTIEDVELENTSSVRPDDSEKKLQATSSQTDGTNNLEITSSQYFTDHVEVERFPGPNFTYNKPVTIAQAEEDYDMEYERLLDDIFDGNSENQLKANASKSVLGQRSAELLENLSELEGSELAAEYGKYKSPGFVAEALILEPQKKEIEMRNRKMTAAPSQQPREKYGNSYMQTSYLLTSDTQLDRSPFSETNSKNIKQLELQDENMGNITHAAVVNRKSVENSIYVLLPLVVELSEETSLLLNSYQRTEIVYTVTNNLNSVTQVSFTVKDEMRILLAIDKTSATLGPLETTTVKVAVMPRFDTGTDRIVFIATGSEQVRKEVIVDVNNNYSDDDDSPDLDYSYTSDCTGVLLTKCKEGTWTIKIKARDPDSGLMILKTLPKGIYVANGYTAGTREEVIGYYSDTCCNADLQIIAIDRANNRVIKHANAYRAPLSFWAITAIVLVTLIILVIIVGIGIFCFQKYRKSEGDSFDLPTYRGGRSRY